MKNHPHLEIGEEARRVLREGGPVVALESTIIAQGMPWPQNLETARRVEAAVREAGAAPATIAVLGGKLKVGLEEEELEGLARGGQKVRKLSRRDLPVAVARGEDGATTVAGTMIIAAMAGIRIFATGGIGGVHRGAAQSMDISADLEELARTDVAVVCAGAKAILDLGLTLEYLETRGVPVWGYRTEAFPAFYVRDSGFGVDSRVDTPRELAQLLRVKWRLGLHGGAVIANPVPEAHEADPVLMERFIDQALREAAGSGTKGKEVTPFLLQRVAELSGGASLQTNIELVLNNAQLAGELAVAYVEGERMG